MILIEVHDRPRPQGSKRHVGNGVMIESSKGLPTWREAVKQAARDEIARHLDWQPLDGPLAAAMIFTLPKPKSAPKRRRTWPDRTPDLSKLIRSTEDALTAAGIWADDARVIEYQRAAKVFPGEDPDALPVPGAVITITAIDELHDRDVPVAGAREAAGNCCAESLAQHTTNRLTSLGMEVGS